MLPAHRCQSCGYDLSAPPEGGGLLPCPECGSPYVAGEHPMPDWPGYTMVLLESSVGFVALLTVGAAFALLGLGKYAFIPAAVAGLLGPLHAARIHGVRYPAAATRCFSRRRLAVAGVAFNAAVGAVILLLIRLLRGAA